jgi:DNA-binding CsgD family transcriptional regulator/PAS domain-containing protein
MTGPSQAAEVDELLYQSPHPLLAFDVDSLIVLGANEAAYELFGGTPGWLDHTKVTDVLSPVDEYIPKGAWKLLTSGDIEGYRSTCHVRHRDGTELAVHTWVRLVTTDEGAFGLVMVEPEPTAEPWPLFASTAQIALVVTDHDWRITHASTDVERILGTGCGVEKGSPLLGLLHPDDFFRFMHAVDDVAAHGRGPMLPMRLRAGDDRWQEVWGLVVAMCDHDPPRLGLAIATLPEYVREPFADLYRPLSLLGDREFGGNRCGPTCGLEAHIAPGTFSTRQKDILMRLARGQRVREIAQSLFLSPSTVRNHMTAIYKKVGVHSQTELLVKLLGAIG